MREAPGEVARPRQGDGPGERGAGGGSGWGNERGAAAAVPGDVRGDEHEGERRADSAGRERDLRLEAAGPAELDRARELGRVDGERRGSPRSRPARARRRVGRRAAGDGVAAGLPDEGGRGAARRGLARGGGPHDRAAPAAPSAVQGARAVAELDADARDRGDLGGLGVCRDRGAGDPGRPDEAEHRLQHGRSRSHLRGARERHVRRPGLPADPPGVAATVRGLDGPGPLPERHRARRRRAGRDPRLLAHVGAGRGRRVPGARREVLRPELVQQEAVRVVPAAALPRRAVALGDPGRLLPLRGGEF
mmetsp:Transcript_7741/g.23607  ORF Transcript_7741/g.23607 Transcript_7741/m.23607 type:complete len:306 (+) Transcript_7741:143-1060(+)